MGFEQTVTQLINLEDMLGIFDKQIKTFASLMKNGSHNLAFDLISDTDFLLRQMYDHSKDEELECRLDYMRGALLFERGIRSMNLTPEKSKHELATSFDLLSDVMIYLEEFGHFGEQSEYNDTWLYVKAGLKMAEAALALGIKHNAFTDQKAVEIAVGIYSRLLKKPNCCEDEILSNLGAVSFLEGNYAAMRDTLRLVAFNPDVSFDLRNLSSNLLEEVRRKSEGVGSVAQLVDYHPHLVYQMEISSIPPEKPELN